MKESELIRLLKEGNDSAFRELILLYGDKVFNTSLGIVMNKEDAEDISQEIFTKIIQSINEFNGQSLLSTWIYRITITKSLEFIRNKNRKKRLGFLKIISADEHSIAETNTFYHPGVLLENKERSAILFSAINKLPERQKVVFLLNKTDGLTYQEISSVMEVSVASVESLMVRARRNLQSLLSDYYNKNEL